MTDPVAATPLTPAEREAFYDAEVAPVLAKLGEACRARGIGIVATVEYAPGEMATTASIPGGSCAPLRWSYAAARCCGNVDALMIPIMNEGRQYGHSSLVLKMLGISEKPDSSTPSGGGTAGSEPTNPESAAWPTPNPPTTPT